MELKFDEKGLIPAIVQDHYTKEEFPQNRTLKPNLYTLTYILFPIQNLWSSPRPISKCQLNTLLCLHLIPIYLVVFKGSYSFLRDISS